MAERARAGPVVLFDPGVGRFQSARTEARLQTLLADDWKLRFAVAAIGGVGFCDTILYLALKNSIGY